MITVHICLLILAIVLAFLAAFNVNSPVALFPLSFAVWLISTLDSKTYGRVGYSLEVREETAIRDINYRNAAMFETAKEAINDAIEKRLRP